MESSDDVGTQELHLSRPRRIVDLDHEHRFVELDWSDVCSDLLAHRLIPVAEQPADGLAARSAQRSNNAVERR